MEIVMPDDGGELLKEGRREILTMWTPQQMLQLLGQSEINWNCGPEHFILFSTDNKSRDRKELLTLIYVKGMKTFSPKVFPVMKVSNFNLLFLSLGYYIGHWLAYVK